MKANHQAKAQRASESTQTEGGQNSDLTKVQHIAKGSPKLPEPDYSSMKAEIEKVKDPVHFEEIKEFYGLGEE